jgi:hypothetical protein
VRARLLRRTPLRMLEHRRRLPTGRRTCLHCRRCRSSHMSHHHRGKAQCHGCRGAHKPPRRGRGHSTSTHEPSIDQRQRGANHPGVDAAIVAATDDVNCTPSPQMTSIDRSLKCFIEQITKRRQPPLLEMIRPLADVDRPRSPSEIGGRALPSLPKRSKRIAV